MPAFLVTLDANKCGKTLLGGANAMVVFAADETAALEICASKFKGDGACWTEDGTATEIIADADMNGWTVQIDILGPDLTTTVSVTGDGTNNTVDEVAALLVTALNALPAIAGAAYDGTTNVLTVAAAGDGLGDHTIAVRFIPPGSVQAVPSLVGTIVDGGAAGDAITLAMPADDDVLPLITALVIQA